MKRLMTAAGCLCMCCTSIPWLLAQANEPPATTTTPETVKGVAAPQSLRLQIPASTAYRSETEVHPKTALLLVWHSVSRATSKWDISRGLTGMRVVVSNLEFGCEPASGFATTTTTLKMGMGNPLPAVQNDEEFVGSFVYTQLFHPKKAERGALAQFLLGPEPSDTGELKEWLGEGSAHFHYLSYMLKHLSGKKQLYEPSGWANPSGAVSISIDDGKAEWHFDAGRYSRPDPGLLTLRKEKGAMFADFDLKSKGFVLRGTTPLIECPLPNAGEAQ